MSAPILRFALALVPILACTPSDAPDDSGDTDDTGVEDLPPFDEMSRDQKLTFMGTTVLPQMKAKFDTHPAYGAGPLTCASCHGEDMEAVDYAMPNGLYPLDYAKFPYSGSQDAEEASWGTFMETEILPAMGALLERELYGVDTPEGFGCFGCHAPPPG